MSKPNDDEPKLIIDEDWKTQVQREKELAAQGADQANSTVEEASTEKTTSEAVISESDDDQVDDDQVDGREWPPANFDFLVTMLASQAMMALGQFPGPDGKLAELDKPMAKHYIDLLGVIEAKTQGNLDASEKRMLSEILHNLRMTFVGR